MYYAHFILNKKGPLAKIWLAAHWDKKLTKAQIYETNIESTIETILEPQMKLALRTSGHLLLGVCRIYSRKVKYLLADCNEAFVKIKLAFRPGLIDLPKEKLQASVDAITLPEKFPEFYVNFADINMEDMDLTKNMTHQQARIEDITLKEDFGTFVAIQDDDFGDMGGMGSFGMDMDTFMMSDMERGRRMGLTTTVNNEEDVNNDVDFFDDRLGDLSKHHTTVVNNGNNNADNIDDIVLHDLNGGDADLINAERSAKFAETDAGMLNDMTDLGDNDMLDGGREGGVGAVPTLFDDQPTVQAGPHHTTTDEPASKQARLGDAIDEEENEDVNAMDESNKKVPVENNKQIRTRRRRKLIIDDVKEIDSATMKTQLSDTSSILGTLELAPPTRKLMELKETGGVDKLFTMCARPLHSKTLSKFYARNMVTRSLVDVTNAYKALDKTNQLARESAYLLGSNVNVTTMDATIEHSVHQDISKNNLLPMGDSYIDGNNDASKSRQNLQDLTGPGNNDLDEFDQFGGPGSIFNTNANLEDMLLDDYNGQINLEITPNNHKTKNGEEDDDEDDDDEDEVDEDGTKRTNKSPNTTHKKRQYRRSQNNASTSNKENKEDDETLFDDTLTNDPNKHLNKRAKTMVSLLNKGFVKNDNIGFFEMTKRNGKKSVVQKFYSLLVLKKYEIIDLFQEDTYGDIIINKGDKFENFINN